MEVGRATAKACSQCKVLAEVVHDDDEDGEDISVVPLPETLDVEAVKLVLKFCEHHANYEVHPDVMLPVVRTPVKSYSLDELLPNNQWDVNFVQSLVSWRRRWGVWRFSS